jgi:ribosomal protein S18 acetylase RimI-like enzyme
MSLTIRRRTHPAELAWRDLQKASTDELVGLGLYTHEEVDAMRRGEFIASWMMGSHQELAALCAEINGNVVGCIQLYGRADGIGVLEFLYVLPPHRKSTNQCGRHLVQEAIRAAQDFGLAWVEVFPLDREPGAVNFWAHLLGTPPNRTGYVDLLGKRWPATGWSLRTVDAMVRVGSRRD